MILCLDAKTWLLNSWGWRGKLFHFILALQCKYETFSLIIRHLNSITFGFPFIYEEEEEERDEGIEEEWGENNKNSYIPYRQNLKHRGTEKLLGGYDKYRNLELNARCFLPCTAITWIPAWTPCSL